MVVGGVLCQGRINIRDNQEFHLGPNAQGDFIKVNVISIHRHRVSVNYVHCGQTATLALGHITDPNWKLHKGMVLLGTDKHPESYIEFEADLMVLYHASGVSIDTCGMIHAGSIRQHARITAVKVTNKGDEEDTFNHLTDDFQNMKLAAAQQDTKLDTIFSGGRGTCRFKFMYEPCYLRLGAQILFMEGKSKCLGRITRLIERTVTES
jgi:GTPase